ncbi:MAG: DNA polymerase III subunit beta [Peptoniphilaceae bacterium]|nr:DNA polymerase III subunit beta [Peptoniphilaceae bacterium]MDY6085309.1 DNA polymerase III subunit beta [Peptoniphilaceae bacterium]
MKFQVQPQELLRRITQCQRAISTRTPMPILECIRFDARDGSLTLMATDLELSITTRLACDVMEEGVVVLPATMIGNIFRKLPAAPATVQEKNGVVEITCRDSRFRLQVQNPDEFPILQNVETDEVSEVANDALMRAIQETEFATSIDESKIALTGIYLERRQQSLRFVALDGYRLALHDILLGEGAMDYEKDCIVPKRAMIELSRILDPAETAALRATETHIEVESGDITLSSRLIDKNYIDYEQIISLDHETKVVVDRQSLRDAVERASLLTQAERAHLIKLKVKSDGLYIESNAEIGEVNEYVPLEEMDGEELLIAFNAKYLLDGIRALDSEKLVLTLNGSLNPMIVRPLEDPDHALYLVLPVRIAGE